MDLLSLYRYSLEHLITWSGHVLTCLLQSKFTDLDSELLSAQVNKYGKYVNQLEKGLPPNSVVPHLKAAVDAIREKVEQEFFQFD